MRCCMAMRFLIFFVSSFSEDCTGYKNVYFSPWYLRSWIFLFTGARGLKLLFLDVPPAADIFSPVTLRCEYDLEGRNLYSVKWYKDGSEFFTYMPDYKPESRAVKTSGIAVDVSTVIYRLLKYERTIKIHYFFTHKTQKMHVMQNLQRKLQ